MYYAKKGCKSTSKYQKRLLSVPGVVCLNVIVLVKTKETVFSSMLLSRFQRSVLVSEYCYN